MNGRGAVPTFSQLVADVAGQQLRALRRIHWVFVLLALGLVVVVVVLQPPFERTQLDLPAGPSEWLLGLVCLVLVLLVLPLVRRRLLDPERVARASAKRLATWGVPEGVPPALARQAVYLSRYSAGSVVSWTVAVSLGLYAVVARLLGVTGEVVAALLAIGCFLLLWLRPNAAALERALRRLDGEP